MTFESKIQKSLIGKIIFCILKLHKIFTDFLLAKKEFSKFFKFFLIFVIIYFSPFFISTIFAQPPNPDPVAIPIDSEIWVLLMSGIGYAVKRFYKFRKNKE